MTRQATFRFFGAVVVVVGLSAFFITRNTRQEVHAGSGSAPGFEEGAPDRGDPRFELAGPTTTAGPTTIPGGRVTIPDSTTSVPPAPAGGSPSSNADPATAPGKDGGEQTPTTATTQPPIVLLIPVSDQGATATPTCSAYYLVGRAGRDTQNRLIENPGTGIATVRTNLLRSFDQATAVLDQAPDSGPDVAVQDALRTRISQMRSIASKVTSVEQGAGVFFPLQLPRAADEAAGWPEILDHLNRDCGEVYRTFGSTT